MEIFSITRYFFSVRLLSVLRGYSFFSSPPQGPMTSDFEGFSIPDIYPLHSFSYLSSWERASIFPFECSVLNKGTTGTIFITSLVWRGPWLMIEPETSRTRSQHYTTRLSMEAVLDWRLNPRPPALEASTLPLGYWGGGEHIGKDYENCIRIQTSIPYMYTLDNNKTVDCKCTFGRRHWHHLDTLRQTIAEGI